MSSTTATPSNFNQGVFFNTETRTDEWATPQDFFDAMNARYGFTLDACATPDNAKCPTFYTEQEDGLKQPWHGRVWMNPPYGRAIAQWVKKAWQEAQTNAEIVVCLLPARTCSAWWHENCMRGEIIFIRHRIKFGGSKINAPFPNALVIFRRGEEHRQYSAVDRHGKELA